MFLREFAEQPRAFVPLLLNRAFSDANENLIIGGYFGPLKQIVSVERVQVDLKPIQESEGTSLAGVVSSFSPPRFG